MDKMKPQFPKPIYVCKGCGKVDTEQFETCNCNKMWTNVIVGTLILAMFCILFAILYWEC